MAAAVFVSACSHPASRTTSIVFGAMPSTERILIAEIGAQQAEKRLGVTVDRKFDVDSTSIAYESLVMSTIDVYPEDTDAMMSSVLKEPLDPNPDIVLNRIRNEMPRVGRVQVLDPLGIRHRMCMVMRTNDAKDGKLRTLSEAAGSRLPWTIAATNDFEQRTDGYSALMRTYNLPLKLAPKPLSPQLLYPALTSNQASLIAGYDTDGPLTSPAFTTLEDDKHAFNESRTCLFVREGVLERLPALRDALAQLSGKFNNETMRKMNYEVEVEKSPVRAVASEFLRQAGQ
jgi:osmoprotectant transport system substrate-binding protein